MSSLGVGINVSILTGKVLTLFLQTFFLPPSISSLFLRLASEATCVSGLWELSEVLPVFFFLSALFFRMGNFN